MPKFEDFKVEILPQDMRIQTYCTRKGGGWAPILENGVKIEHLPTGIAVSCDEERSAHANRATAMKRLCFLIGALSELENVPVEKRKKSVELFLVDSNGDLQISPFGDVGKLLGRKTITIEEGEGL